jgi:hypothetical protein
LLQNLEDADLKAMIKDAGGFFVPPKMKKKPIPVRRDTPKS